MSAEGMGLAIGFATMFLALVGLFITMVFQSRESGRQVGITQEKLDNLVKSVAVMDTDNKAGHEKIFDCQKETDVKVGKVEQHLLSINGNMKAHSNRLNNLENENHKE